MPDEDHLRILHEGVDTWNGWRSDNPDIRPDLSNAELSGTKLRMIDLSGANLSGANLSNARLAHAKLYDSDLSGADLSGADLWGANLSGPGMVRAGIPGAERWGPSGAILCGADLSGAILCGADLSGADLCGADLSGADLTRAQLVETAVGSTRMSNANVYGISAWNLNGTPESQTDLVITRHDEPVVTVDDLKVAQFIYLLLSNPNIRDVIDTITSKVVLILGRFTKERKKVLDALRDELRRHNLTPVLFDFDVPKERNITETVTLLARMARFVIADLTDPRSIPQELQAIVPHLPSVPVQPIIVAGQDPWGMFPDFREYPWMLSPYRYEDVESLLANLDAEVIGPPDDYRKALEAKREST